MPLVSRLRPRRALRSGARLFLVASLVTKHLAAATVAHSHHRAVELSHDGTAQMIRREPSGPACESQCVLKTDPNAPGSLPAKYFTQSAALFSNAATFYRRCVQAYRGMISQSQHNSSLGNAPEDECSRPHFHKGVRYFLTKKATDELNFDETPGFLSEIATAENFSHVTQGELVNRTVSDGAEEAPMYESQDGGRTAIRAQFAAYIGTLYAGRQAYVALGALRPCAVQGVLKEISQKLSKLLTSIIGSNPNTADTDWPWIDAWRSSSTHSEQLLSYLKTPEVTSLLDRAAACARPFNYSGLTSAFAMEQRERVQPPLPAISNDSVIMLRGPGGVPTAMPLLGLGTGYDDCFRGHSLKTEARESGGETLTRKNETCDRVEVPEDWSRDSRFGLVDTAALYGSEPAVGKAMAEALRQLGRNRKEFFVVTKPPVKAMWQMLGVNSSTAYLNQQLKDLQTDYVDVLLHHHDAVQPEVWAAMESVVAEGRARMLGVSGNDQAEDVADCVRDGLGCTIMPAIAEMAWNPCSAGGLHRLRPQTEAAKVTILGTSVVWPCLKEPHIAAIAHRHGVPAAAVSVRFALQNGVPSLVQTHKTSHLRAAAKALEISLSDLEMAHIGVLPLLYRFKPESHGDGDSFAEGPGLRALGIESSHVLGF